MLDAREEAEAEARSGLDLISRSAIPEAIAAFSRAVALDPAQPQSYLDLGAALRLADRKEEAVEAFSRALELRPCWPAALYNLGLTQLDSGNVAGALAALREAGAHQPDWNLAHSGLGMAQLAANDLGGAEASFQKAFDLDPKLHAASHYLAFILSMQGATAEAIAVYREGLRQNPCACHDCHLALSLALLQCGKYEEGWSEYEWRWNAAGQTPSWAGIDAPLWDGSPLDGKRILLWAEQGLGDILQFVRFATLVRQRGGEVSLLSRPNLDRLLTTCSGVARVASSHEDLGEIDVQLPLASLPRVLGITLDDLPAVEVPYLAPPEAWAGDPFGPRRGGALRVGIVWGVDPGQPGWMERTCPLPAFAPLESVPGVELYSLQFGARAAELRRPDAPRLADLSGVLGDFARTAALVEHLDLVITVDTSMAHLAGAIGKPVWTLLHSAPDWRWLRGRTDSPWYPTMRLFRQQEPGRWEPVIEQVVAALREARPATAPVPIRSVDGPAIYYHCPDVDQPCGGIKQIYRHVDLLNRHGFPARVVHATPGFRCTWFDNATQVQAGPAFSAGPDDFIVLPEIGGPDLAAGARGWRKVIFNQNCYLTFQGYPITDSPARVPYLDPEVLAAMVVSEDSAAYLSFVFPHLDVERIHNGLDTSRFNVSRTKKDRIAFLGTKNQGDMTQVVNILRLRGRIEGYELIALRDRKESEVAGILRETAIFLNFANREGFALPPAEAMACGCLVVGYHGGGGKEYFLPDFSYPVQDGDIPGFVAAVEEVVRLRRTHPGLMAEKARAAAAFIRERYSLDREERDVIAFWNRLLAAGTARDRVSRPAA